MEYNFTKIAALQLVDFDCVDMYVIENARNIIAVMPRCGSWRLDKDTKLSVAAAQSSFLTEIQASVTTA